MSGQSSTPKGVERIDLDDVRQETVTSVMSETMLRGGHQTGVGS
jgi:hypothetical protein